MTIEQAISKLKNMRMYMEIEDEKSETKFSEDDYTANDMAVQALEKQVAKKPIQNKGDAYQLSVHNHPGYIIYYTCPTCGMRLSSHKFPCVCGQKIDWGDRE